MAAELLLLQQQMRRQQEEQEAAERQHDADALRGQQVGTPDYGLPSTVTPPTEFSTSTRRS